MKDPAPSNLESTGSHERVVYIMDDDAMVGRAISRVLANAGFAVRAFTRVPDLEMALTTFLPHVILLDLSLGESDAVEAIRRLAGAHFSGAVLLMSGRHDSDVLEEVENIGRHYGMTMLPFLQKPIRLDELESRLAIATSEDLHTTSGSYLENEQRSNWLELWYQPKIELKSRRMCGAEALIRLKHPERGILPPLSFLPGPADPLHKPLAGFVMRRALADWSALAASGIITRLAINVPISVFETPDFVCSLRRYLSKNPKFPGLIIELTEDEVLKDPGFAREIAIQLKLYNIGIAIDDFGTGHSTLERLKELPFTELKIDRKYVDGCSGDKERNQMCRSIIALAHRMNVTVVAEGVESFDDLHCLVEMGCDVAQGFFFGKPMQIDGFNDWVLMRMHEAPQKQKCAS
jgi:EAL domain-containing protein (putative c-di-GMP-specific phosphodiesterase class I)